MIGNADVYQQVLADLQAQLAEVEHAVAAITTQLDAAKAQRDDVKGEVETLRKSIKRQFPESEQPTQEPLPFVIHPRTLSPKARTEVVEEAVFVLTNEMGYASPESIEALLLTEGRSDSRQDIGGALSHLHRTHRVSRISRGRWVPLDPSLHQATTDSKVEETE